MKKTKNVKKLNKEVNHVSNVLISDSGMTVYFLLELPIYDQDIPIFIIDDNITKDQLHKDLSEFLRFDDEKNEFAFYNDLLGVVDDMNMCVSFVGHFMSLIAKRSQIINKSTIVHECTHIKSLLFRNKGIKSDPSNDEPEAYLMGFLFREIEKIFNQVIELKLLK